MRRLLGPLLALAVVVAACGEDDDGAPDAGSARPTAGDEDRADVRSDRPRTGADDTGAPATTAAPEASPPTTVDADRPAGDGPAGAGEDEGAGDVLLVADLGPVGGDGSRPAGVVGRFEAELVEGVLCADLDVGGLDVGGLDGAVTGAHVHEGSSGAVVVDLGEPSDSATSEARWRDVCREVADDAIDRLAAAPGDHHVDVHTTGHPDGAARGPVAVASIFDRTIG